MIFKKISVRFKSWKKKLCAISSGAHGRTRPLRKASALQNFAILWSCNIKKMEGKKGAILFKPFCILKIICYNIYPEN